MYSEPEARATGRAGWLVAGSGHARDDFLLFVECTLQHLGEETVGNAKPAAHDVRLPAGAELPDLASTGRRSPWHQVTGCISKSCPRNRANTSEPQCLMKSAGAERRALVD